MIEVDGAFHQIDRANGLTELQSLEGLTNQTRIKAVPGLFALRAGLYGRQVALAWNDRRPANDPSAPQRLNVQNFRSRGIWGQFLRLPHHYIWITRGSMPVSIS